MSATRFSFLLRAALALVLLAAGLAALTGFDRIGHRFTVLEAAVWMPWAAGAVQVVSALLLMMPGRVGYGAALAMATGLGATLAHASVLGWDSAPPAMGVALTGALILWRNRADLMR